MSNMANIREVKHIISNLTEDEMKAVAMEIPSNILLNELSERLAFSERKNIEVYEVVKKERIYGKTVEEAYSQGTGTVERLSSKLVGMGQG